ncbi:hypothetical protein AMTRI_Chr05g71690 [Amborella trichopoda]
MHARPLIFLHSDASWMLIAPDLLMRTMMISVFTYGLLLLWLNGSYLGWATIMVRGRVTRWTWSSRSTLVNNWYKCLENRFNYGTRALADASYMGESE